MSTTLERPFRSGGRLSAAEPGPPVSQWAQRVLRRRFDVVLQHYKAAVKRYRDDEEHVHQARISCRRAVAALDAFSPLLPEGRRRRLVRLLKRIRRAAGEARDVDVFRRRLKRDDFGLSRKQRRRVRKFLKRRRKSAQQPLKSRFEKCNRRRLKRRFDKLLSRLRWRGTAVEPECETAVPQMQAAAVQEFLHSTTTETPTIEDVHELRIQCKQLRYALELYRDGRHSKSVEAVLDELKDVQDRLGTINDHAAGELRLREWKRIAAPRGLRRILRRLADAEGEQARLQADRFRLWWKETGGAPFRERLESLAAIGAPSAATPHNGRAESA